MNKRRLSPRKKSVAIMALLVIASLGVPLFVEGRVAEVWNRAMVQYPQSYTVLSFLNTGHLPTYVPAGTFKTATFRLTNNEAVPITYHYRALLIAGAATTTLADETVTLDIGASVDKTLTFTLPQPETNAQVTVQLINRTEYITFGTAS